MSRVSLASRTDVKDAAETIVKAFIHDPFNLYFYNLIQDPANPPRGTKEMMALHIRNRMITEPVWMVNEGDRRCAGVALWDTPQTEPLGWFDWAYKKLHSWYGNLMGYLYYHNNGINRPRFREFRKIQAEVMERVLGKGYKEDTYYLHYLATHPDHQGRGIASALIRHVLKEADERECRCFLEASKYYPNVPIYEHFGFKLVETIEMSEGKDSIFCMLREPQPVKVYTSGNGTNSLTGA